MGAPAFDGSQDGSPVGHYTYAVADDHWSWSEGVYALHGYEPGGVAATTEVLLAHKHPDDRARAYEVLETAIRDGHPFSCYHRIIDATERVRSVLSVGRCSTGADGAVEQVMGFFVDLTDVMRSETQTEVDAAMLQIAETRSVIDQAKGMLMLATGCDADEAFGTLRHYSSHKNLKLNDVAQRMVEEFGPRPVAGTDAGRTAVLGFLDGLEAFSGRTAS